ncbi:MAG: hypothetical protein PHO83_02775 [Geobacteraceae bacterium]|nr:hypothetical protein [Geobacteraceae bacterium]
MASSKKRLVTLLVSSGLLLLGLLVSTQRVYSEIPEPQCVCDGCGYACGSGHSSTCIYKPQ